MTSLWSDTAELPSYPSLNGDIKTDVLIIGGGMAGILTAYFLHRQGVKYILVEKDRICSGTTGSTTAKITFQHGLIYDKIIKSCGEERGRLYLEANKAAFEAFAGLCKNIDCDYEIRDNYVYSTDDRHCIEAELAALDKIGYKAELFDTLPLPIEIAGVVCFRNQAQFHPLKFLSHIARGLNIREHTFVREMIGNTAITNKGKISAEAVIVTTHFPFINKHGSYFLKLYQHRSYITALENAEYINGMYVDKSKTGMSFRSYKNLLLLGGGGHRTGKKGGCWEELRHFARKHYPQSSEVYRWAAQDCMSLDGLPYIGHYSCRTAKLYTASGFNKWGMTGSMLSAILLSGMAAGKEHRYSYIFSPSRCILTPQLFANAFEAAAGLLTISKKRCPHLGCALKWNNAEHTWDCSCHGSRFTEGGKVLDNPANGSLRG